MKNKLIFIIAATSVFSTISVHGVEKDSVMLSKNPEINKYITHPITPTIEESNIIISPAVEEYRLHHIKDKKISDSQLLNLEFTPEIISNDIKPREIYNASPYAGDWKNSGVIINGAGGTLVGNGSFTTILGMGSVGTAGVNYLQNFGNFSIQGGVYGSKLNINGYRFNNFGVNGKVTYTINDWLAINAYGSYAGNNPYLGLAPMAYMGSTNFGATVTLSANDNLGIDLGAERYYDPYNREWRTRPVVAPYAVVGGNKIIAVR